MNERDAMDYIPSDEALGEEIRRYAKIESDRAWRKARNERRKKQRRVARSFMLGGKHRWFAANFDGTVDMWRRTKW